MDCSSRHLRSNLLILMRGIIKKNEQTTAEGKTAASEASEAVIFIEIRRPITSSASVTRFGNLLHFGQLFKACGNN